MELREISDKIMIFSAHIGHYDQNDKYKQNTELTRPYTTHTHTHAEYDHITHIYYFITNFVSLFIFSCIVCVFVCYFFFAFATETDILWPVLYDYVTDRHNPSVMNANRVENDVVHLSWERIDESK